MRDATDAVVLSSQSEIGFGSAQDQRDAALVAVADALHPVPDVEERLLAGDVEQQHHSVGFAEVGSSQRAEALLPCSVTNHFRRYPTGTDLALSNQSYYLPCPTVEQQRCVR